MGMNINSIYRRNPSCIICQLIVCDLYDTSNAPPVLKLLILEYVRLEIIKCFIDRIFSSIGVPLLMSVKYTQLSMFHNNNRYIRRML